MNGTQKVIGRWKVALINWDNHHYPQAVSYVLTDDGDATLEMFHTSWREALERVYRFSWALPGSFLRHGG